MGFLDSIGRSYDALLGVFNPKAELKRAQFRAARELIRKYEGASKSRRTKNWNPGSGSSNEEIRGAIETLRNRSRDLGRNNAYAKKAFAGLADNIVGTGIRPAPVGASQTADRNIKKLWSKWASRLHCDFEGTNNFYGLQWLAMKTLAESGEVLIIRRKSSDPKLPVPLQLQVLEGDYIDTSKDFRSMRAGEAEIVQGVEFDRTGRKVAIWLYDRHPGDGFGLESKRVPIEDVIHLFLVDRPGQSRGIPMGHSAMIKIKDFDEYEDAQLIKQKISACFGAFVTTDGDLPIKSENDAEPLERLEPGIIEYLPSGKTVTFSNPPSVEGYDVYTRTALRAIAAGFGVTYEMLTGDLSNVNFSSGRMGGLEFNRLVSRIQYLSLIPRLCDPVWDWFMDSAVVAMKIRPGQVVEATWTAPGRVMIDPVKETQAMKDGIRTGLLPWQEAIRELGSDPDEVLQQLKADKDAFKSAGLMFEWDPEMPANGGKPKEEQNNDPQPGVTQ